jgi:hypothetical protein
MDTESIKKWLQLQSKDESSLKTICRTLNLSEDGKKEELVNNIINGTRANTKPDEFLPQLVPLRTRDKQSNLVQEAATCFKNWRRLIFQSKEAKEFLILNNQGKNYKLRMKYLGCSRETALEIIERKWHLPTAFQTKLIEAIRQKPEAFEFHIVQKPSKDSGSFIMLHVRRLAA